MIDGLHEPFDKIATRHYFYFMRSVGLKILENKLSENVRLAASGETEFITDRDRVVAELVPPREGRSSLLADAVLAEAVRKGWMTPPIIPAEPPPPCFPVAPMHDLLLSIQIAEL
jgi:antitoxin (DNA-binding transcriptional repressor) of toxin-antitoxin stability system